MSALTRGPPTFGAPSGVVTICIGEISRPDRALTRERDDHHRPRPRQYKLGWSDEEDYVFKPKKGLNE